MNREEASRDHALQLLRGGDAHADLEKTIADFPADLAGAQARGLAFTPWQLLEHMRIAQWDIIEFSRNSGACIPRVPGWLLVGERDAA